MSLQQLADGMRERYGDVFAVRWLNELSLQKHERPDLPLPSAGVQEVQESFLEHESHIRAAELLEPFKTSLGAAYRVIHLLARWSLENATERDLAPHLMTTYWTLEEATGLSERTLRRHIVEDGHPWSEAVRSLIDVRLNHGPMLNGKDERGADKYRTVITNMVIRFFPKTRLSANARVKRWGNRDLLADADKGRTRFTRSDTNTERQRYARQKPRMSAYQSLEEQCIENNWFLVLLGQAVLAHAPQEKSCGNLYADIPKNNLLDALRADLQLTTETAQARGTSVKRARSRWVDMAAKVLARRHGDQVPRPSHEHKQFVTHHDGFTDLWRRCLWTAVKSELYGGTRLGWTLLRKMIHLIADAVAEGKTKPVAWSWVQVRDDLEALRRDYGSGAAGECLVTT